MKPKKPMAKEKFSKEPSTLGRELRRGESMRHVPSIMDNPGCWYRRHAFAGHFHQRGLVARPRRPAPSPSESPRPDSKENLALYLEVKDFTRSYDTSERAKAFNRLDATREGTELVFEYSVDLSTRRSVLQTFGTMDVEFSGVCLLSLKITRSLIRTHQNGDRMRSVDPFEMNYCP